MPRFHVRSARQNHLQSRNSYLIRPALEALEDRRVLAGTNTFAQFVGTTIDPAIPYEIQIEVDPGDFPVQGGESRFGFHLQSADGLFDPAAIEIRRSSGNGGRPQST